jgi:hypothetical protein
MENRALRSGIMPSSGFKELTPTNWLEPDDIMVGFVARDPDGEVRPISANHWAESILSTQLAPSVPQEVQDLFAVARGGMLYGFFFYPLYTLAAEQLFRVGEAAVGHKALSLGVPRKYDFNEQVNRLRDRGVFTEEERGVWHTLRHLRNAASHSSEQTIFAPPQALSVLSGTAEMVNGLFG